MSRYGFDGFVVRVPLGKGVSYRYASGGKRVSEEYSTQVDKGTFTVTNRRVAFLSQRRLIEIPLAKIANVQRYTDAIAIAKEGRESIDAFLMTESDRALVYLEFAMERQKQPKGPSDPHRSSTRG